MAVRLCPLVIPSGEELGLPPAIEQFARYSSGLVLITGPTGSGKTTTLNHVLDLINAQRRGKIITIEDPIEFVHQHKQCLVVQQEVYTDVLSFSAALTHVLRQNPDVIAIGEMRDLETMATALTAAETGHLVLATLHTPNVFQTIERISGIFPPAQQPMIVLQLANTLRAVVAQELLPRVDKPGRVLATEVLVSNPAVRNLIRENSLHLIPNVLQTSTREGMHTMDRSLTDLYEKGIITYEQALARLREPESFRRRLG